MTFAFLPGHRHSATRDAFIPTFRRERELAGVTQVSREMLDSSENSVQRQDLSRWPLSAFRVVQAPEGHVNGQTSVCVCVCEIIDSCREGKGAEWFDGVAHITPVLMQANGGNGMLLRVLSQAQVAWIWRVGGRFMTRKRTRVFTWKGWNNEAQVSENEMQVGRTRKICQGWEREETKLKGEEPGVKKEGRYIWVLTEQILLQHRSLSA